MVGDWRSTYNRQRCSCGQTIRSSMDGEGHKRLGNRDRAGDQGFYVVELRPTFFLNPQDALM